MPKIFVDDREVEVEDGLTILQACKSLDVEIPHFCFHEKLKIAGNCRMCLVEVEKMPKPVASCALNVTEGMKVYTKSEKVIKARGGVMEFLLINHPLDCPICDQGGECDLQDQAFKYGKRTSRYDENKRSVENKDIGPLIKTVMNRCIHCTRCVRFSTEVAGVPEMGAVGRGEDMQITSYLEKALTSELSGNMIDLCPVGALTSKPYAFTARPWELRKTDSIDVMDAVGSNIRVDSKGLEVMRVLPQPNEEINEEWISDKIRFSYDGLKVQRLDVPYIKQNGKLKKASWEEAFSLLVEKFKQMGSKVAAIAGPMVACEPLFVMKKIMENAGSKMFDANQHGYNIDTKERGNYLFNTTIAGLEQADLCLIIGADIQKNAPIINARIGKMIREGTLSAHGIGQQGKKIYDIEDCGNDPAILQDIMDEKHPLSKKLKKAKKPMMIIGDGVYSRTDSAAIFAVAQDIAEKYGVLKDKWNGYNVLHNHASMVGALDLGFAYGTSGDGVKKILKSTQNGDVGLLYLMNADEIDLQEISDDCFVVYQGHHGDLGAGRADLILPEASFTEQDGIYVNLEGRPQYTRRAVLPVGQAKASIDILLTIAKMLGQDLGANLQEVRTDMAKENVIFANIHRVMHSELAKNKSAKKISSQLFKSADNRNYYMDNVICKNSSTMAKCAAITLENKARD